MRKIYIANPENKLEEYRLIINVTEDYSIGVELQLNEINMLFSEIKELMDNAMKNRFAVKTSE